MPNMPGSGRTMPAPIPHPVPPGGSLLGGAASGLSYEGALRDALARDEQPSQTGPRRPPRRAKSPAAPAAPKPA